MAKGKPGRPLSGRFPRNQILQLRLTFNEKEMIQGAARRNGEKMTEYVVRLVREDCGKQEKK